MACRAQATQHLGEGVVLSFGKVRLSQKSSHGVRAVSTLILITRVCRMTVLLDVSHVPWATTRAERAQLMAMHAFLAPLGPTPPLLAPQYVQIAMLARFHQ